jgi:hypothetical protein
LKVGAGVVSAPGPGTPPAAANSRSSTLCAAPSQSAPSSSITANFVPSRLTASPSNPVAELAVSVNHGYQ